MFVVGFAVVLSVIVLLCEAIQDPSAQVSYKLRLDDGGYPRTVFVSPRHSSGMRVYTCYRGLSRFEAYTSSDRQAFRMLRRKLAKAGAR